MRTFTNVNLNNDETRTLHRCMGFADAAINQKYPIERPKHVKKFSTQIRIITEHKQGTHDQFQHALEMALELKGHLLSQTQTLYWQAVAAAAGEYVANADEFAQHYVESAKACLRDLEPAIEIIQQALNLATPIVDEDWDIEEVDA